MAFLNKVGNIFRINLPVTLKALSSTPVFNLHCVDTSIPNFMSWTTQWRSMSYRKRRHTHPPYWYAKQKREPNDERITGENKEFIKESMVDRYGHNPVIADQVQAPYATPLADQPWVHGEWKFRTRRTGLIARKIGVYPMWEKDGTRFYTTLLQVLDNHVINYIPPEEANTSLISKIICKGQSRFGVLIVGAESSDPQLFTKEYCGLFDKSGVMPKRKLTRFLVSPQAAIQPGTPLYASHFNVGDYVDVYGKTIERGFQGVMKRWHFKGMPATHGVTKSHRRGGHIGGGAGRAKVWRGKKMPGHMGSERRVQRGLKIWRINTKENILWVHGSGIPGPYNSYVYIFDTRLPLKWVKDKEHAPPFPTYYPELHAPLPEEIYHPDVHEFNASSILYTKDDDKK